ncbi:MAG: tetratricopeptide repeat protein, partial [Ktedonobacteraceae bacterium]
MAFFPGFSFSSAFLAPRQAASSFSHRITVQFSTTFAPPISINSSTNSLRNSWDIGRYEEALVVYEQALLLDPKLARAHTNKGFVLAELERREAALSSFDQALYLNPNEIEALYNKGLVLYELGYYEKALEAYDQALHLKPDFALAYNNKGVALFELERYQEALAVYEQ